MSNVFIEITTNEKGSRRVAVDVSTNFSEQRLKRRSDSFDIPVKRRRSSSLKYHEKSSKCHRMSEKWLMSPHGRKTQQRERSRTEDSLVTSFRNVNSRSVFSRLSMSGGSGLCSPVYSDADAWVTDSIAEKSYKSSGGKCPTKKSKGPFLGSYQLLGDSLFVRFADQILKSSAVIGANGKFCNGYCVSGQTIKDLHERISQDFTSANVLVLIGTNDFLRKSYCHAMENEMKRLIEFLSNCVEKIVLLTLPPIPRLKHTWGYWSQWESYNNWLKTLDNGNTIKVIDVAPLFMLNTRTPDMLAFESHMGYGDKKRVDHIHLNRLGLQRLYNEVKKQLNIN